jgi:hypothetical protein
LLPVTDTDVRTGLVFGVSTNVAGVTLKVTVERKTEAYATSTKYPPPTTGGTGIGDEMAPVTSLEMLITAEPMLHEDADVEKHRV